METAFGSCFTKKNNSNTHTNTNNIIKNINYKYLTTDSIKTTTNKYKNQEKNVMVTDTVIVGKSKNKLTHSENLISPKCLYTDSK